MKNIKNWEKINEDVDRVDEVDKGLHRLLIDNGWVKNNGKYTEGYRKDPQNYFYAVGGMFHWESNRLQHSQQITRDEIIEIINNPNIHTVFSIYNKYKKAETEEYRRNLKPNRVKNIKN